MVINYGKSSERKARLVGSNVPNGGNGMYKGLEMRKNLVHYRKMKGGQCSWNVSSEEE